MPGARDVGVEFFTLSKSYNMPGWRVGFAVGNREIIGALARIKSYLDYGTFQPVQIAAIAALERTAALRRRDPRHVPPAPRRPVRRTAARRLAGPEAQGDDVRVGARSPSSTSPWARSSSAKFLLREAKVAVSPGIGFGEYGDQFVRFALIENEHRTRQALRGIKRALGASLGEATRRAQAG